MVKKKPNNPLKSLERWATSQALAPWWRKKDAVPALMDFTAQ